MVRLRFQHGWGIRKRVLFLSIVPMFLVSIMIGFYLTKAHLSYMHEAMAKRGEAIARNLGLASEFSLLIEDRARLQELVNRTYFGPEVEAVIILDENGQLMAQKLHEGFAQRVHGSDAQDSLWEFYSSVETTSVDEGESEELRGQGEGRRLGQVIVYVSRDHLRETARKVIVRSILFILFGLLFASLLALLLARELLAPIQRITDLVGRVQRGDLSSRLARRSGAEIGELEQGINRMVKTIEGTRKELEERVAEATSRLQETVAALREKNIALETSRREAIEAGQAKERFLAHVSHELRTPLNAIVGFAELLEKDPQAKETREYTRVINNASQQLLAVINDVLSYSELSAGRLSVEKRSFRPQNVLEDVVSLLSRDAHCKGLELVLLIHRDTPRAVIGDPVRFSQVLTNLLVNAVKFTASGEILVVSESMIDEEGRRYHLVSVEDSGIGIPKARRDALFEPFVQGDSSIQKRYGGTGLGLTISRSLMELMGGKIWLADGSLGGSRFCVALPADDGADVTADQDMQPDVLQGIKVLVTDSHAVSRRAIKNMLLSFGMQVFLQPTRQTTEQILKEAEDDGTPFQVLVIGGKADEFPSRRLVWLRNIARDQGIRILVLISDEEQVREKQRMVKHKHCIVISTKPIRRQRLLENLQQVLECKKKKKRALGRSDTQPATNARVLIADDNAFSRQLLQASLERCGIAVDMVTDGFELVEQARQQRYDLIFLDIHMPAMDGLAAAQIIREETINNQTPLIAVTADLFTPASGTRQQSLFNEILFKPVSPDAVSALIEQMLPGAVERSQVVPESTSAEDSRYRERFKTALEDLVSQLETAAEQANRDGIKNIAHQINGLTGYFGHQALSRQGRALEQKALSGAMDDLRALIDDIRSMVVSL